ncbi:MAG: exodeoxyribonuclease VII small subunit [Synergistaceae bacterium]|nr:exodeoxyribonuclease VII small subunit [Synergistaceae bacterium]
MSFDDNLKRLDGILKRLESEPLPLDEALAVFEEGVGLVRESEALLKNAEQKVTVLSEGEEAADFEEEFEAGGQEVEDEEEV